MPEALKARLYADQIVSLPQLRELKQEQTFGQRHEYIPHYALVETLNAQCAAHGLTVHDQQLGLSRHDQIIVGTMRVQGAGTVEHPDMQSMIGFRNSTAQHTSIKMIIGLQVMVCTNMCMSGNGEYAVSRKNTSGINLPYVLGRGIDRFLKGTETHMADVERMQNHPITTQQAKAHLFDLFNQSVLPKALFQQTGRNYLQAGSNGISLIDESCWDPRVHPYEDCKSRSLWGLNNACTRAVKDIKLPASRYEAGQKVGRFFQQLVGRTN
jgi:hypothetical protein